MTRVTIPKATADNILNSCRHRCCICVSHKRVANIHHIDGDNSNNSLDNLVALCAECHADAHTKFAMRRNLTDDQIKRYRFEWNTRCQDRPPQNPAEKLYSLYYINIERLIPLYKQLTKKSLLSNAPVWFSKKKGSYDSLWANRANSLDWQELLALREYLENCVSEISQLLTPFDVRLFENGAADPKEWQGEYVAFNHELVGRDIPDQPQVVDAEGDLEGPPPTLRSEVISEDDQNVFELCMMLNPRYFYSDSAFIQFSETSVWSGVGISGLLREAVGSNDGHRLRSQLLITPLWIGRGAEASYEPSV